MIKYNLACKKCNQSFDSWFSSSKEYDKLKKLRLITCYNCGSQEVDKNLISPNVLNFKRFDGEEIVYHDYCDVSIAVSAPKGLVVPVIRNAETLSFDGIEKR